MIPICLYHMPLLGVNQENTRNLHIPDQTDLLSSGKEVKILFITKKMLQQDHYFMRQRINELNPHLIQFSFMDIFDPFDLAFQAD